MEQNQESSVNNEQTCNKEEFFKIVKEFLVDLLHTFPEYKDGIFEGYVDILQEDYQTENCEAIYKHSKELFPKHFFDILYQNESLFEGNDSLELLLDFDFKKIMNDEKISEQTQSVVWKYLQMMLMCLVEDLDNSEHFGDTAKLFEAINENDLKDKLEETMESFKTFFDGSNNIASEMFSDVSNIDISNLPQAGKLHEHLSSLLKGNIGKLAEEIANETATELDLDLENETDAGDVMKKMFNNPGKLMSLVKKIGSKLQTKLDSGEVNKDELLKEAQDMMSNMENMPGMSNIKSMMSKMGMPMGKNMKARMGAVEAMMNQNMRQSKTRERMLNKLKARQSEKKGSDVIYSNDSAPLEKTKRVKKSHQTVGNGGSEDSENINLSIKGKKPRRGGKKKKHKKKSKETVDTSG